MMFTKEEIEKIRSCVFTIFLDSVTDNEKDGNPKVENDRYVMGSILSKIEMALEEGKNGD